MIKNSVILDIDGVLADYRLGLLWWINAHYPEMREVCYKHLGRVDTWINAESLDIPHRKWYEILERFRMSGGKLSIPHFPGSPELFELLYKQKTRVILLTSRPIDIYPGIYRDTIEWLREKNFNHHLLLWSKDKADIVFKLRLLDEVRFAVDDELKHAELYAKLGIQTYWLNHYRAEADFHPRLIQVQSLSDIIELEKGYLNENR